MPFIVILHNENTADRSPFDMDNPGGHAGLAGCVSQASRVATGYWQHQDVTVEEDE